MPFSMLNSKSCADRFALEDGCIRGSDAIVAAAKDTEQGGVLCMCKFITSPVEYTKEVHLHELFADNLSPLPGALQWLIMNCHRNRSPRHKIICHSGPEGVWLRGPATGIQGLPLT